MRRVWGNVNEVTLGERAYKLVIMNTNLVVNEDGKLYLVIRSLLQQHVSIFVEQEDAEGAVESDVIAINLVAVALTGRADVLIIFVYQNAVLVEEIEWQHLVILLGCVGELLRKTKPRLTQEI